MNLISLAEDLGLEEEEYVSLVELFIETTTSDLENLLNATRRSESSRVAELAHSIKGASINLGFTEFSSLAKQIEMSARDHLLEGVSETASILGNHLNALKETLEQRLQL